MTTDAPMTPDEVQALFEEHHVLQRGHFKLSSGRHSDTYFQKQRIFEYPRLTARLAAELVARFPAGSFNVVASPAVGALVLGAAVANVADTRFVFSERVDGSMMFRRGQQIGPTDTVLVVEDIVTTGGSAAEVVTLVAATGATLTGVAILADRSMTPPAFPLTALLRVDARDWPPEDCPLCASATPIDSPGSRAL